MKRLLWLLTFLVVYPVLVFAARPLSTNDSGTVDKGSAELEYGVEFVNGFDNEIGITLAATFGVLSFLDFGIEVPYSFIDAKEASDSDGFSDVTISSKLNFIKDHDILPDSALSFSYKTESANDERGLGTGRPEYSLTGIFSKCGEEISLHLNLGYTFKKDFEDTDNEDALTYGLAAEYVLNNKVNLVAEISGDTVLKRQFHDNSCSALIGFNYSLRDNIVLDFGVNTEISHSDPDFKVISGITIAF